MKPVCITLIQMMRSTTNMDQGIDRLFKYLDTDERPFE